MRDADTFAFGIDLAQQLPREVNIDTLFDHVTIGDTTWQVKCCDLASRPRVKLALAPRR